MRFSFIFALIVYMFGMSLGHLLILSIVVLIFGPKRISALAEHIGRSVKSLRDQIDSVKEATGVADINRSINAVRENTSHFREDLAPNRTKSQSDPQNKA